MITNTELENKGNLFPSQIIDYQKVVDTLNFTCENGVILQLTVQRDSVLRFRYCTSGVFENDFSYAITKYASRGYNFLEVTEKEDHYVVVTSKLKCKVRKEDLRITILDKDDFVLCEDELGFHWEESYDYGGNIVKMSKSSHDGESYYGLGDKPVHIKVI